MSAVARQRPQPKPGVSNGHGSTLNGERVRQPKLTPKQEAFARTYVEIGNASEAYRRAYRADGMTTPAVEVEACRLIRHPKVSLRVLELQQAAAQRHNVTIDSLTKMLLEEREVAHENGRPAVDAVMGLAKLHGLIVEKKQKLPTPPPSELQDLTDAELMIIARGGRLPSDNDG